MTGVDQLCDQTSDSAAVCCCVAGGIEALGISRFCRLASRVIRDCESDLTDLLLGCHGENNPSFFRKFVKRGKMIGQEKHDGDRSEQT